MQLEAFFGKLELQLKTKLPFVCFATKTGLKAYLQPTSDVHTLNDYKASGFVFVPFSEEHPSVLLPSALCDIVEYNGELTQKTLNLSNTRHSFLTKDPDSEKDKLSHEALVSKAIRDIKSTSLKKVICSRTIKVNAKIDVLATFKTLTLSYPKAYCYCWYHPEIGTWLGATPEQFVHVDRNKLKTVALAGTQHKADFPEAQWSAKEIEEQGLVTDYILEALQNETEDLNVGQVETVSAGNLWHLKTEITATVNADHLGKIIDNLHPTSAVCGMPKKEAKAFIKKYEGYDRSYYSGFLGELNAKVEKTRSQRKRNQEHQVFLSRKVQTDLYVNLRCMQIFADSLHLYVGGGITIDSKPTEEYLETKAKSQTLLNVI